MMIDLVASKLKFPTSCWLMIISYLDFIFLPILLGLLLAITIKVRGSKSVNPAETTALERDECVAQWFVWSDLARLRKRSYRH